MSDKLTAAVWGNSKRFPRDILLPMLALANRCGDRGVAHIELDDLAQDLRVTRRQLRRVLNDLVARGEVRIKRGHGKGNKVSTYQLTVYDELRMPQLPLPTFTAPLDKEGEQAVSQHTELVEAGQKGTFPATSAQKGTSRARPRSPVSPFDGFDAGDRRAATRATSAQKGTSTPPHPPGSINTHLELSGDGSIETVVKGGVGGKGDERAGNVPFSQPLPYSPAIEQWVRLRSVELHDPEHLASNAARAMALWRRSRLPAGDFLDLLQEARKIAQGRRVAKAANGEAGDLGLRNRMPYLFAVVEQRLGQRSEAAS